MGLNIATAIERVQYIGAYHTSYARHRVIQQGLRDLGVAVDETVDRSPLPARWWKLAQAVRATRHDVPIIVGEAGNYLSPVLVEARRVGRPVVFDPFVSLRDTLDDRQTGWRRAALAPLMERIDRVNNWAAGAVLLDTERTRAYFVERLGLNPAKAHVVPVGAETSLFVPRVRAKQPDAPLRVLFYGTFIPLHGIDIVIRAAAEIQQRNEQVRFQIVGSGQTYQAMRELAAALRVSNVDFGPHHVSYTALPDLIASADVCLGIFADRPKTRRVVPNKLYQCIAMGVPVVTADTPAIRDGFGDHEVALVPPGDHRALADAIVRLAHDQARRVQLGRAGLRAAHERYAPSMIAQHVLHACEALYG